MKQLYCLQGQGFICQWSIDGTCQGTIFICYHVEKEFCPVTIAINIDPVQSVFRVLFFFLICSCLTNSYC